MTIPTQSYTAPARWLHWSMAALVLCMIPAGVIMTQQGLDRSLQNTLFIFHKNTGVLLIILIVIRMIYRARTAPPPEPAHLPAWQAKIAGLTHAALYGLLLIVPVSGYIRVKAGGFPIETLDAMNIPSLVPRSDALAEVAKSVHYFGGLLIAALIVMHIGAALHHGIVKKDGVFSRMWPGGTPKSDAGKASGGM